MAQARYDAVADFYQAGFSDPAADPAATALLALLGEVSGQRVLDAACGHGRISRLLADLGGDVTGVDLSAALLARARDIEQEQPRGISYLHADVSSGEWAGTGTAPFDAVVCHFGLSDIDDLNGALSSLAGVIRPGGRFVFSILHPCFAGCPDVAGSWPADASYYRERWWRPTDALSTLRRQVGANHRMLSSYLNALRRHDLHIDEVAEPKPGSDWAVNRPECARQPVYLVARCIKQ